MSIHRCSGGSKLTVLGLINGDLNSTWETETHVSLAPETTGHQLHPFHIIVVLSQWE